MQGCTQLGVGMRKETLAKILSLNCANVLARFFVRDAWPKASGAIQLPASMGIDVVELYCGLDFLRVED